MSIKVKGSDRPLTPIEVSKGISEFKKELNGDYDELSKRLGVSKDIIKDFEELLSLPAEIQDTIAFGTSKSDSGKLSFTTAAIIAELKDSEDMLKVGLAVLSFPRPITKTEVDNIVSLKRRNSEKSIEDCIAEIVKMRPNIVRHYLFVSSLDEDIRKQLTQLSLQNHKEVDSLALEIFSKEFPENSVKKVHLGNEFVRISFTKEGHNKLHQISNDSDVLLKDVVNHVFRKAGIK